MSEENFDEMEKTAEEEKENKEIDEEEEKRKEQEKKALEKKRIRKRNRRIKNVMIAIGSILTYQFIVNRIENYKESLKDIAQYANNEKLISELNNETYRNIYNLTPEDVMQLESLGEQISEYRRLKEIEKRTANEDLQLGYAEVGIEEYKEVIPTWYEKIVTGEISLATGDPSKKITISVNNEKEAQICINEGTEEEEKWDSGNVMFHKIPKQLEVAIKKSQNKYNDYIAIVQAFDEISGIYNYTFRENGFTKSIKAIEPEF